MRRLILLGLTAAAVLYTGCTRTATSQAAPRRVIVLGIDGMDPKFLEAHWDALPNLNRLARTGDFKRLATTIPPQSPVAWSTFITGMDPGGHGIYDFIHRNPNTMMPFSSMSEAAEGGRTLSLGPYVLPLTAGRVKTFRTGQAFWQLLSEQHVPVNVLRMPTNFPPVDCEGLSLSGMGTPDMRGTFGTFTFFTDAPDAEAKNVPGGQIVPVRVDRHRAVLRLQGPQNTLRKDRAATYTEIVAHLDPTGLAARFETESGPVILRQGEWSEWIKSSFGLIPGLKSASGMYRLYIKELQPRFAVYVSPINIDPESPDLPISDPPSYSRDLARSVGPYYTQGMAEDTAALRQGVLTRKEYLSQASLVASEHLRLFRHALDQFKNGLLFYHFFGVDQNSHMLWGKHDDELLATYKLVDDTVGYTLAKAGDALVIVMSDHGFSTFDRSVHLNTWLMQEGFLQLQPGAKPGNEEVFVNVDWARTQAYSVGLNGLYINLQGRERDGSVPASEKQALLERIRQRLLAFRDPGTGKPVVDAVYAPEREFRGKNLDSAPDLLVGYTEGYRSSWQTALGAVPPVVVEDNTEAWIGDHCISPHHVPGVLLSNRDIRVSDPKLQDVTLTILAQFGVKPAAGMAGRNVF